MSSLTFGLIEDDPEIRLLLSRYLGRQPGFHCGLVCGSVEQFLAELPLATPPDVLLLDVGLPGLSGLDALPLLKKQLPHTDIIMQTVFEDPDRIYLALCRGASGYVLKNTPLPQLRQAMEEVAGGGAAFSPQVARRVLAHFKPRPSGPTAAASPELLSPREQQVLEALIDGLADKEIAQRLALGAETVRTYVKSIYKKLHVTGRIQLLSRAARGQL